MRAAAQNSSARPRCPSARNTPKPAGHEGVRQQVGGLEPGGDEARVRARRRGAAGLRSNSQVSNASRRRSMRSEGRRKKSPHSQ